MKNKKRTKRRPNSFFSAFLLALVWTLAVCSFSIAAFSYGINRASGVLSAGRSQPSSDATGDQPVKAVIAGEENWLERFRENAESYLRQNIAAIAEANAAGGEGLAVDNINFIGDGRALVFYGGGKDNDRYLAEIVFRPEDDSVKIERFILKIKNDTDYSNGLYGAD